MGRKGKKEKKKKYKHHKEKHRKRDRVSSGSESEDDGEQGVVWEEKGRAPEPLVEKENPENEKSEDEEDEIPAKSPSDELFNLLGGTSRSYMKNSQIEKNIRETETKKEQNRLRYTRELNSYFRDDVNKKFVDDENELRALHASRNPVEKSKEEEPEEEKEQNTEKISDAEMNALNARLIKAEMLGDQELVAELKNKLKGCSRGGSSVRYVERKESRNKSEQDMSVKELYLSTKKITARDEAMRFVASSSKIRSADDEYEYDVRHRKKAKLDMMGFDRIQFTSSRSDQDQSCDWCPDKVDKSLLLKFPFELKHCYVALTRQKPFVPNVCHIVSRDHSTRSTLDADNDCWQELRQIMRTVAGFYQQSFQCATIFMETLFLNKKRHQNLSSRHFVVQCVPIKQRYDADAKIFFHKAILESGEEWSINRKLIKLEGKSVTKRLPKGLSYFWVSIGPEFDGFGHVIEDEDYFDRNFGQQVISGLYEDDGDGGDSKRARHETRDDQFERVRIIKNKWRHFFPSSE